MTTEQIQNRLKGLLDKNDARCLFAVESGSRAWGFESETSDYDVRFVYWKPVDSYLSTKTERDVLEEMGEDDLDFAGWDIRKALNLAAKSNPSLHDWLVTHIVYDKSEPWFTEFKELCESYFCPQAGFKHYVSMAKTNFALFEDKKTVPYKKYFYVLRPLLCAKYIREHLKPAPCLFSDLLDEFIVDVSERAEIEMLLEAKRIRAETALGPRNQKIFALIRRLRDELNQAPDRREQMPVEPLDEFFRRLIRS